MNPVFDIGGPYGILLLAAPLLLLASALMWALFWPGMITTMPHETPTRHESAPKKSQTEKTTDSKTPQTGPAREREENRQREEHKPAPQGERAALARATTEKIANGADRAPVVETVKRIEPEKPLDPRIAEARESFDQAIAKRDEGNDTAAADHLRNTIMLASVAKDKVLHARARLELGDICKGEGDLTTACEHWQLARSLFEETAKPADAEVCEKRMIGNGCPTDWVLTDF